MYNNDEIWIARYRETEAEILVILEEADEEITKLLDQAVYFLLVAKEMEAIDRVSKDE